MTRNVIVTVERVTLESAFAACRVAGLVGLEAISAGTSSVAFCFAFLRVLQCMSHQ